MSCYRQSSSLSRSEIDVPPSIERTFLTPRHDSGHGETNVPTLDEFDAEIDIYRVKLPLSLTYDVECTVTLLVTVMVTVVFRTSS